jgi:hypothetical protein
MRPLSALTSCLIGLSLTAQLWSPPGAIWNYSIQTAFTDGCQTRVLVGDTVIDGRSAQQFHVTGHVLDHIAGTITETDTYFHTSVEDSIVFAWTSLSGQWEWDTLYRFNAVPGDRWWPIGADESTCGATWGMLQVVDTGVVMIGAQSLRSVTVAYLDQFGVPENNLTFIERLGSPLMVIPPGGCIVSDFVATLRTYQDNTFPLFDTGEPSPCDLFLGMDTRPQRSAGPVLYPNPGHDQLWIGNLEDVGHATLRLHDITGRIVMEQPLQGDRGVDVSHLPSGAYQCSILDRNGWTHGTTTWIKQ